MIDDRLERWRERVSAEIRAAIEEEHTPHQVAASFAIGLFLTALPTGGLGVGAFFVLVYWWSWVSKPAIFSTVLVLNPFVKPFVYVASYSVGVALVGTEPVLLTGVPSLDALLEAVQHLLVGNVLVAVLLSTVGYVVVRYSTRSYRRRKRASPEASTDSNTTAK